MPWTAKDATHSTKKASTPKKKKQWKAVANNVLSKTGDDGLAKRIANGVIARQKRK